jgi:hypothetical protein
VLKCLNVARGSFTRQHAALCNMADFARMDGVVAVEIVVWRSWNSGQPFVTPEEKFCPWTERAMSPADH